MTNEEMYKAFCSKNSELKARNSRNIVTVTKVDDLITIYRFKYSTRAEEKIIQATDVFVAWLMKGKFAISNPRKLKNYDFQLAKDAF